MADQKEFDDVWQSVSQEFEAMRGQHEQRIRQLESEVFQFRRNLKHSKKDEARANYTETPEFLAWHYDVNEFPLDNIEVRLKDKMVHLHAHRYGRGCYHEINREFLLPKHVDGSMLSATMSAVGTLTITAPCKSPSRGQKSQNLSEVYLPDEVNLVYS